MSPADSETPFQRWRRAATEAAEAPPFLLPKVTLFLDGKKFVLMNCIVTMETDSGSGAIQIRAKPKEDKP